MTFVKIEKCDTFPEKTFALPRVPVDIEFKAVPFDFGRVSKVRIIYFDNIGCRHPCGDEDLFPLFYSLLPLNDSLWLSAAFSIHLSECALSNTSICRIISSAEEISRKHRCIECSLASYTQQKKTLLSKQSTFAELKELENSKPLAAKVCQFLSESHKNH